MSTIFLYILSYVSYSYLHYKIIKPSVSSTMLTIYPYLLSILLLPFVFHDNTVHNLKFNTILLMIMAFLLKYTKSFLDTYLLDNYSLFTIKFIDFIGFLISFYI